MAHVASTCLLLSLLIFIVKFSEGRINPNNARPTFSEDPGFTTAAIQKIDGMKTPLKDSKSFGKKRSEWVSSYQGRPFDITILYVLSMPLVIGKLAKILFTKCRPVFEGANKQPQLPLIPLVILQASRAEREIMTPSRNGIRWFGEKFLIHANAEFIDIDDAEAQAARFNEAKDLQEFFNNDDDKVKSYWGHIRAMLPVLAWYRDAKKRIAHFKGGTPLPYKLESQAPRPELQSKLQRDVQAQDYTKIDDIYNLKAFYKHFRPKSSKIKIEDLPISPEDEQSMNDRGSMQSIELLALQEMENTEKYESEYIRRRNARRKQRRFRKKSHYIDDSD